MKKQSIFCLLSLATVALTSCSGAGKRYEHQSLFQSIMTKTDSKPVLPSKGNSTMLVIPVKFKESQSKFTEQTSRDECKELIHDAFIGDREDGQAESLKSFYNKSSYGMLDLNCEVMDWYECEKTYKSMQNLSSAGFYNEIRNIITQSIRKFKETKPISALDTDGDKYLDGCWVIFDAEEDDRNFWPHTNQNTTELYIDDEVRIGTLAVMTVGNLYTTKYDGLPDTHTLIHETGHELGLLDYYDYDGRGYPAGAWDMMDFNILDHNAYSKYLLGWVEPTVVKKSQTITLKPFQEGGECFLIPAPKHNGSPFSEYYIFEYYTPTGLNKLDIENPYYIYSDTHEAVPIFSENGLRMYHVDSHAAWIYDSTGEWDKFITNFSNIKYKDGYHFAILTTNSATRRNYGYNFNTLELVNTDDYFRFNRFGANQDMLSKNPGRYSKLDTHNRKWNDGTAMNFTVEVKSMSDEGITVEIKFS